MEGMLTLQELSKMVEAKTIDTILTVFCDCYGRLMGKRLNADFFLELIASQQGVGACNYLLTVDIEMQPVSGYHFTNWEKGYGDFSLQPDMNTLRIITWLEKTALVMCDVADEKSHALIEVAPRTILKKQLDRAKALGFTVFSASELEYYCFQDSYRQAHEKKYHQLQSLGWYIEDYDMLQGTRHEVITAKARRHLQSSGVPVENSKGEWGLGQHELNIKYTDALEMADRHLLLKQCLKELAEQENMSVSFMAKMDKAQAGSSCHIHLSLWREGKNIFPGNKSLAGLNVNDEFQYFLGGWMKHCPDIMVLLAPTINSYKRYQDASWAPTRLGWSVDNRTAGFRVVGHGQSLRIECRLPGADCNPYLAFAGAIAAGLDGIENAILPPDCYQGDVYQAQQIKSVPLNLAEANVLFSQSQFVKNAFGQSVQAHYTRFYENEWQEFMSTVTDWEKQRYFERI